MRGRYSSIPHAREPRMLGERERPNCIVDNEVLVRESQARRCRVKHGIGDKRRSLEMGEGQ